MTNEQKTAVERLRAQGLGYKRIAAQMCISANTVKSYLRKIAPPTVERDATVITEHMVETTSDSQFLCRNCGKPVAQHPGRKEKKFCSDSCRARWWNSRLGLVKRKAIYDFTCPACGKDFTVYGNAHRKYCCHPCYIKDRFGGAR